MQPRPIIVPVLSIGSGLMNIDFYINAFGATEMWRISNPNGSVHVAAFSINGTLFRLHEQSKDGSNLSPEKAGYTTVTIALDVEDVEAVMAKAASAGATVQSPAKDYEYGYRQGTIKDPFGHYWLIEKLLDKKVFDDFLNTISKGL